MVPPSLQLSDILLALIGCDDHDEGWWSNVTVLTISIQYKEKQSQTKAAHRKYWWFEIVNNKWYILQCLIKYYDNTTYTIGIEYIDIPQM